MFDFTPLPEKSEYSMTAYLAPLGFESDLEQEIKLKGIKIISRYGRLFLTEDDKQNPSHEISWAQDTWPDCETVSINSIADGAKKLKQRGVRWALFSQGLHRRASLIQTQLPKLKAPPLEFLDKNVSANIGSWTLLDTDQILISNRTLSPCPRGEVMFKENRHAPSRAYLKLWELFTLHGIKPKRGERCLDLGASPGGWTWVLNELGCQVVAVDRSPLAPQLMKSKNIEFIKRNALTIKPNDIESVDWFFSDVICYPKDLYALVEYWLEKNGCRNFVCTLKFKGPTDHAIANRFSSIPNSRLRHLYCNKHELTWWLTRK